MTDPIPMNANTDDSDCIEENMPSSQHHSGAQVGLQAVAIEPNQPELGRSRRWHFKPDIHVAIANRKLAVSLNTQTGFLEADQDLVLTPDEIGEFLDAISDNKLDELVETIDTIHHFAPVKQFLVSELSFSKTGEIRFELLAEGTQSNAQELFPSLSFERIQFTLNREGV